MPDRPFLDGMAGPSDASADTRKEAAAGSDTSESQNKPGSAVPAKGVPPSWGSQRYQLRGVLGQGGFGTVYLGWDQQLHRQVAIKIPREDFVRDESTREAFLREARVAARLQHPGIVVVHDCGVDGADRCYVVYEYVAGKTLRDILDGRAWPIDRAARLVSRIAEALHAAHKQGLVHRDLKPANILLDDQDRPRIADFGLAVDEDSQRQQQGEVAGTLAYMAPEQLRGEVHHFDGRTDLWALGAILYELLAGRRPFRAETRDLLIDEIFNREARPLRQLRDDVPAELDAIVLRCLSKKVSDRYGAARDLAEALRFFESHTTTPVYVGNPLSGLFDSEVNSSAQTTVQGSSRAVVVPRRRALQRMALAGGGLAAGALTLRSFLSSPGAVQPTDSTATRSREAPGVWHDLLDSEPAPRVWSRTDGSSRMFQSGRFWIQTPFPALFELGNASSGNYEIQIQMEQTPWTGGFGLYFGLREWPKDREVLELETIALVSGGKEDFQLRRTRFFHRKGKDQRERTIGTAQVGIGRLVVQSAPRTLAVQISDGELRSVRFDNEEYPQLYSQPMWNAYPLIGPFGIIAEQTQVQFRSARYRFE